MSHLAGILGVARYERIMLTRTIRFRVLGGMGIALPVFFGVVQGVVEVQGFGGSTAFGEGAFIPFFMYSFLQTIVIAFIAGDFRAADERAHVHEVLAVRPLSTTELVLGKYLGVLQALVGLSLVVMSVTVIVQAAKLSILGTPFRVAPYLGYLLLMNLPGLVYMTALTFFLGAMFRNRTAAALVVMAYVIITVFFLGSKYGGFFDFGAFHAPLYYSDLLGFGDLTRVVQQRVLYLALAALLIGLSVERYPRLPQGGLWRWAGRAATLAALATVISLSLWMVRHDAQALDDRARLLTTQQEHARVPAPEVIHYDLDVGLMQAGAPLTATAAMQVRNPGDAPMELLVFTLNPGLELTGARGSDGAELAVERVGSVVRVPLSSALLPGLETFVELRYAGTVDPEGFDLIRTAPARDEGDNDDDLPKMPELTAWIRDYSVFLPTRSRWYPSPGVDYGHAEPVVPSFSTAEIRVTAPAQLTIVTQGEPSGLEPRRSGQAVSTYTVQSAVPALSINGGQYDVIEAEIGGIDLALYVHPEHWSGITFLSDATAEIQAALRQLLAAMERETGLPYPYPRLSVVEVPFLVQWYYEGWREVGGLVQPGVLMVQETELTRHGRGIQRGFANMERNSDGGSEPASIKRDLLVRAVFELFLSPQASGLARSPLAQLWSFDRGFVGEQASLLERGMPVYLQRDVGDQVRSMMLQRRGRGRGRFAGRGRDGAGSGNAGIAVSEALASRSAGIGPAGEQWDRMLEAMQQQPFTEMTPAEDPELYRSILDTKGLSVFRVMQAVVGAEAFVDIVEAFGEQSRYQGVSFDEFERAVVPPHDIPGETNAGDKPTLAPEPDAAFDADLGRLVNEWLAGTGIPGYTITRATAKKVENSSGAVVHQVVVRVRNGEPGVGFVQVKVGGFRDEVSKGIQIEGGTEVEVSMVIAARPSRVTVEPFFAKNRRGLIAPLRVPDQVSAGIPESYVHLVTEDETPFIEIIVDNEDEGFSMPLRRVQRYLRPGLVGDAWGVRPARFAFGRYETNFRYKSPGDGAQPAVWSTQVPRTGEYDVAYYFLPERMGGRRVGLWGLAASFELTLVRNSETRTLRVDTSQLQAGWNLLGRFAYDAGDEVSVELSDRADGRLYADAVRWRFVDPDRPDLVYEEGVAPWDFQRQGGRRGGFPGGGGRGRGPG